MEGRRVERVELLDELVRKDGVRERQARARLDAVLQDVVGEADAVGLGLDVCEEDIERVNERREGESGQVEERRRRSGGGEEDGLVNQCAFSRPSRRVTRFFELKCAAASVDKPVAVAMTLSTKCALSSCLTPARLATSRCRARRRVISAS